MKKIKNITILSVVITLLFGCFTDKSGLDTHKIGEITIEVADVPEILRLEYLENLTIEPNVKIENQTNPSFIEYRWEINQTPGSTEMVVIGNERKLSTTITNRILPTSYALILTVIDTRYQLEYQKRWPLFVSSAFREGIVVADTKDGATSDISLIMDNNITASYNKGESIFYNIWENSTGENHKSLIKSISYTTHRAFSRNLITTIFEDKEIYMYDCENYSVYKKTEDIFPNRTANFDPQAFYTINNDTWVLINNNIAYAFPNTQGITSFLLPVSGTNYVDNGIMTADNSTGAGPYSFWYDSNMGGFYNIAMTFTTPASGGAYSNQGVFNPQGISNRRAIAADISTDGVTSTTLLYNKDDNKYELYSISFSFTNSPSTPKLRVELPTTLNSIIESAVSIFFAYYQPVMYIATESDIYAVTFGGGVISSNKRYSVPAGETITKAKLFMQGRYRLKRKDFNTTQGPIFEEPLDLNTNAIIVATNSGNYSGQLYIIPNSNTSTGELNIAAAKKYSGFGKILDFTQQGQ